MTARCSRKFKPWVDTCWARDLFVCWRRWEWGKSISVCVLREVNWITSQEWVQERRIGIRAGEKRGWFVAARTVCAEKDIAGSETDRGEVIFYFSPRQRTAGLWSLYGCKEWET